MGKGHQFTHGSMRVKAAAFAVAALLSTPAAKAQGTISDLIDTARQQVISTLVEQLIPAPLILKPSLSFIGAKGGHSSHSSHRSHSSHYSSSGGSAPSSHSSHASHYSSSVTGSSGSSARDPDPEPPPVPLRRTPPPPVRDSSTTPAPDSKPVPDTIYPFLVYLKDGRQVRCDVQADGTEFLLVKKAGTIRVTKNEVDRIERVVVPTTRPTTQPVVDVEKKN